MNYMAALKAGIYGLVLAIGIAFLGYIPIIEDLIQQIGWAVGLVIGALYITFAATADRRISIIEASIGGAAAGLITIGIQSIISTIYFGGMFERLFIGSIIGGLAGAVLGATGAVGYLYARNYMRKRRPKAAAGV